MTVTGDGPAVSGEKLAAVERRLDPADGRAYTKQEFMSAYGTSGTAKWNRAIDSSDMRVRAPSVGRRLGLGLGRIGRPLPPRAPSAVRSQ